MRSLAHEILKQSTIPLWIMRRAAIGRLSHKILVPIVDDALSRVAIAYAHDVARNFESTLLFCTLDQSFTTTTAARALVDHAREDARALGIEADAFLLSPERNVSEMISQSALVHGYDAIVMATHLREGFARLVEGSVTEAVIYASNVPVLVVRSATPPSAA